MPVIDKDIGFDLIKSDWVIPYGQGVNSDFIFRVVRKYKDIDNFDASITINFNTKWDGIQAIKADRGGDFNVGSEFRLPRNAPEKGYKQKLVKHISEGTYGFHNDESEDNNYFFRVRSEVDKDGKLKRAMYGKIRGEIKFSPRSKDDIKVRLYYYLNPDYTRNLEFDPSRNLFKNLPDSEGVELP